jgi:hypothetical protein
MFIRVPVRATAKYLCNFIKDEELIRSERDDRKTFDDLHSWFGRRHLAEDTQNRASLAAAHMSSTMSVSNDEGMYDRKYFWLSEAPVPLHALASDISTGKPGVSHAVVAWASQTGKGLLFFSDAKHKTRIPKGIIHLGHASALFKGGPQGRGSLIQNPIPTTFFSDSASIIASFTFKIDGVRKSFHVDNAFLRDHWVEAIDIAMTEGAKLRGSIESSEGYKKQLEYLDAHRAAATTLHDVHRPSLAVPPRERSDRGRIYAELNGDEPSEEFRDLEHEAQDNRMAQSKAMLLSIQNAAKHFRSSSPTSAEIPSEHNVTSNNKKEGTHTTLPSRKSIPGSDSQHSVVPHSSEAVSVPSDARSQHTLAGRLDTYFATGDSARSLYTDTDIYDISAILKHQAPRWSKVPRTYVVLRVIGHLDLLDHCLGVGFSDYWFPVTERNLPDVLRPSVRAAFVAAQALVLTQSMGLEKGEKGQHCYFRKGDTLPLETKGILGTGGYGQVDRVLSLISFKEYARKRVLRSAAFRGRKKEDVKQFIAEIEILKRLKHRHVVEFVGSYTDSKYIGLIMTPIADGDLAAYLSSATPDKYPELRTFFGCLATALEFLHSHNVRHKDIKPGNILVKDGTVLFADFGLSFDFTDATGSTTMSMVNGMTPRYCAPEVANHQPRNTMSDIWCLGVVFLEMIVTLKGESIQYMDAFLQQHGTEQAFIRLNAAALPELIAHLATLGQWADNKALEWTEPMLSVTQTLRPTAAALVSRITAPIREGENTGFCGICCVLPEEEDFSDYASD